jgi:hypothetical protein
VSVPEPQLTLEVEVEGFRFNYMEIFLLSCQGVNAGLLAGVKTYTYSLLCGLST